MRDGPRTKILRCCVWMRYVNSLACSICHVFAPGWLTLVSGSQHDISAATAQRSQTTAYRHRLPRNTTDTIRLLAENQTVAPFKAIVLSALWDQNLVGLESESRCTSWTLESHFGFSPGRDGSLGIAFGRPMGLGFELVCASTDPTKKITLWNEGPFKDDSMPRLTRGQCRTHSSFWIMLMGSITAQALIPALCPPGKSINFGKGRTVQLVGFCLLMFLHFKLCTRGSADDHFTARVTEILARYHNEEDIIRDIVQAVLFRMLLPILWQFISLTVRPKPTATGGSTHNCRLVCRVRNAFVELPYRPREAELVLRKAFYISAFPILGMFLTWPAEELLLDRRWSPVPFLFLALISTREDAETLEMLRFEVWLRKLGQEKRLQDEYTGTKNEIGCCVDCVGDRYSIVRWVSRGSDGR